ncbi:MAG: histidinol-phosphate transaminase [Legionellaceae bacterium]|nr:histidinol-phosphate transaminase [Legionellaceae bacterium]
MHKISVLYKDKQMVDLLKWIHSGIQTLMPYQPGKSIESLAKERTLGDIIKLASNENPLGCSPAVLDYLRSCAAQTAAVYPSMEAHPLHRALADFSGVSEDMLLLGNGSDPLFGLIMTVFALHTERWVITHAHAFSTYVIQAETLGIPVHKVADKADGSVDVEALLEACKQKPGIVFLANPNNPTGWALSDTDLLYLMESVPEHTLMVLDQAYHEYAPSALTQLAWLSAFPRVLVTRTFSKIYGLAGLRLGYVLGNPELIQWLARAQLPFTVNRLAMDAGLAALTDQDFVLRSVVGNTQNMQSLVQEMQNLGLSVRATAANFIVWDTEGDAQLWYEYLLAQGIIVRPLHPYQMPTCLRITVGTPAENKRFIDTIRESINLDSIDFPIPTCERLREIRDENICASAFDSSEGF